MKKKFRDSKQTQCTRIKLGAQGTTMHKKLERISRRAPTDLKEEQEQLQRAAGYIYRQKKEKELMKSMRVVPCATYWAFYRTSECLLHRMNE